MGYEAIVEEILPPITPIQKPPVLQLAEEESPAPTPAPVPSGGVDEEVKCATPKSKDYLLNPMLTCPPAPRKPWPEKRKLGLPPRSLFVVTRDLASVFVGLSDPVKKKIKVG